MSKKQINLRITLTEYCSLRCSHCFIPLKDRKTYNTISLVDIDKIILQFNNLVKKTLLLYSLSELEIKITIFGGEVFELEEQYLLDSLDIIKNKCNYDFTLIFNTSLVEYYESVIYKIDSFDKYVIVTSYDNFGRFNKSSFETHLENLRFVSNNTRNNILVISTFGKKDLEFDNIPNIIKIIDSCNSNVEFTVNELEINTISEKVTQSILLTDEEYEGLFLDLQSKVKLKGYDIQWFDDFSQKLKGDNFFEVETRFKEDKSSYILISNDLIDSIDSNTNIRLELDDSILTKKFLKLLM